MRYTMLVSGHMLTRAPALLLLGLGCDVVRHKGTREGDIPEWWVFLEFLSGIERVESRTNHGLVIEDLILPAPFRLGGGRQICFRARPDAG